MIEIKSRLKVILTAVALIFTSLIINAQDGEALFKSTCGACHKINEHLVGPPLEGVNAKWEKAGEKEFLYEWVKDSQTLIASGKSKMAVEADKMTEIPMAPQAVTTEDIDAIFAYIDAWVAPVEEPISATGVAPSLIQVKEVEGLSDETYSTIFSFQLLLLIFLLGAAVFYSSIVKKLAVMSSTKVVLAMIGTGLAMSIPTAGYSLSMNMSGDGSLINASFSDNLVLLLINIILLGLVLYLKGVITSISSALNPEFYVNREGKKIMKKSDDGSLASVLTGQIPLEDEDSILIDHDFDGIQELDNHLPPWWLWSFYASIVFAFYYHAVHDVFGTAPDQYALYETEMAEAEESVAAYLAVNGPSFDETTVTLATEEAELSDGKTVFAEKCVVCHMADGQGSVGPNLTDDYWLFDNDIKGIFKVVKNGTKGGMPEHDSKLKAEQMRNVSSYILTLPYTEGKEPQGDKK